MKKFLYGFLVLSIAFSLSSCNNVGPVIKVLKKINTEPARHWITFLKENGIDAIDENGNTILLMAVQSDDPKFVEACLKSGADVNISSKYIKFPLTIAVEKNNVAIADMLLKKKASLNPRESENCLAIAMKLKNQEMIDLLLKYKPDLDGSVNRAIFFREPPTLQVIESLDKAGYKPSPDDLDQIIQAYYLATDETEKQKLLSFVGKYAKNPVYNEPMTEDKETVLTKQYTRVDTRDTKDFSERHIELPVVKVLLESGLTPDGKKGAYNEPVTAGWYISTFARSTQFKEVVELFMKYGFDINKEYLPQYASHDETLLYTLADLSSTPSTRLIVLENYQYLISLGADPNAMIPVPDYEGNTPAKRLEMKKRQ
ncbi:MAG: Ankyrin repeats (3 copies) [Spirochaetes bacterium ADurb.Bin215]|nr:MAG: Ankyrin repeats (3 copies) [Spirochaetes bacterium ADurb.Bin215]